MKKTLPSLKRIVLSKILSSIKIPPTSIVERSWGIGIAWNTTKYYCDIEIHKNKIEFTISKDRKSLQFTTTNYESIDEGINQLNIFFNSFFPFFT